MKNKLALLALVTSSLVGCGQKEFTTQEIGVGKLNLETVQSIIQGSWFIPQTLKPGYLKDSEKLLALYVENKCDSYSQSEENVSCQKLVPQMNKADKELWKIHKKYHNTKNICSNHLDTIGVKTKKECKIYLKQKEKEMQERIKSSKALIESIENTNK